MQIQKKYEQCGNSCFNTHIVALCVALRRTQTAVGSQTGITMVGMAMTLTSGQKTERESQRSSNKEETQLTLPLYRAHRVIHS